MSGSRQDSLQAALLNSTLKAPNSAPTLTKLAEKVHKVGSVFYRFPAIGTKTLQSGAVAAVPFHNYDGDALIIWGSADPFWVHEHVKGPWKPVLGTDGRAQVAIWIIDYKDTVVNPYKELIITFAVVHHDRQDMVQPVQRPQQLLQMFDDKLASPYIYKLWLDEKLPIEYGRELLGCDKYFDPDMELESKDGQVSFEFHHVGGELNQVSAGPLLKGKLELREGMGLYGLIRSYGFFRTLGMAAGAANNWHVVNPPDIMDKAGANPVFDFVYETSPKFTDASDQDLEVNGELKEMGFKAVLYQHDPHLRAVILSPWTFTPVES